MFVLTVTNLSRLVGIMTTYTVLYFEALLFIQTMNWCLNCKWKHKNRSYKSRVRWIDLVSLQGHPSRIKIVILYVLKYVNKYVVHTLTWLEMKGWLAACIQHTVWSKKCTHAIMFRFSILCNYKNGLISFRVTMRFTPVRR